MRRFFLILLLLSLFLGCGKSAGIENSSETTNGFVATAVDANGDPVVGAIVSIWEADSREKLPIETTTTGTDGSFIITAETVGDYRLQVVKEGIGYSSRVQKSRELVPVKQVSLFALSTMEFSNSDDAPLRCFLLGAGIDTTIHPGEKVALQLPVSEAYEVAVNDGTTEQELTFDLRLYDTGSVEVTDIAEDLSFNGADGFLLDSLIMVDFLTRHSIGIDTWSDVVSVEGGRIRVVTLDNRVTEVGPSVRNLSFLWRLLLPNNTGITLADEITKLDKLTELELSGCGLSSVPEQVDELGELKTLNLGNNNLSLLPEWLDASSPIVTLILNDNEFTTLPPQLLTMSQLQNLVLSENVIGSLSGVEVLTNLENITVQNCSLTTLAPLYTLSNLTKIKAPKNQITELTGISNLTKLNELWLGENSLEDLPEELFSIRTLSVLLQLNSNKLTTLSPSIGNLTNLRKLQLEANDLVTLPDEITNMTSLNEIYVGYNRLGIQSEVVTDFLDLKAEENWATKQK